LNGTDDDNSPAPQATAAPVRGAASTRSWAVQYAENCVECGARFVVTDVKPQAGGGSVRIRLRITNTGELGDLDFGAVTGILYALNDSAADRFAANYEEQSAKGTPRTYLTSLNPKQLPFVAFESRENTRVPATSLQLGIDRSLEAWLLFRGDLPADVVALVVRISSIGRSEGMGGWLSFQPGQPFIQLYATE
jgi:hypothetical protein